MASGVAHSCQLAAAYAEWQSVGGLGVDVDLDLGKAQHLTRAYLDLTSAFGGTADMADLLASSRSKNDPGRTSQCHLPIVCFRGQSDRNTASKYPGPVGHAAAFDPDEPGNLHPAAVLRLGIGFTIAI